MNKLRLVKLLVFFLTFVLIFGMILAGQIIYRKASQKQNGDNIMSLNLNQPKGSYLVDYKVNSDMIVMHIKGGNSGERLISVDAKGKAIIATINLN